jgi:hypothetical protein
MTISSESDENRSHVKLELPPEAVPLQKSEMGPQLKLTSTKLRVLVMCFDNS